MGEPQNNTFLLIFPFFAEGATDQTGNRAHKIDCKGEFSNTIYVYNILNSWVCFCYDRTISWSVYGIANVFLGSGHGLLCVMSTYRTSALKWEIVIDV